MVKISIIIPVYNVENYLGEALDSILNQSFQDFEVIMVDDGSQDNSKYICEKYAFDYDNFHVYHKENEGQAIARNYALKKANGEYIHFMDADDYLHPQFYEKLFNLALKNDSDFVVCNALRFRRYNIWDSILFNESFGNLNEDINSTNIFKMNSLIWDTAVWNKLYKREFLVNNNLFYINKKIFYEDLLFSLKSYLLADSVAISNEVLYYWRVRADKSSTSQQLDNLNNFADRLEILRLCEKSLITNSNVDESLLKTFYMKLLIQDFYIHIKKMEIFPKNLVDETIKFLNIIPEDIKDDLDSFKRIIYKMIEDNDIKSLLSFTDYEDELSLAKIPSDLNQKYLKYINFDDDAKKQDLIAEVVEITNDDENIFIEFSEKIKYVSVDNPHDTIAKLVYGDEEYDLYLKNNLIKIPINLVKDKSHLNVKIIYKSGNFIKETFLKNKKRNTLTFGNIDVDIGIGELYILFFDIRIKNNNRIDISDISFEDNEFKFTAKSIDKVSSVFIQNVINFDKLVIPVEYVNSNEFTFSINYQDILNSPIKKWELNCETCLNNVSVSREFNFFTENSKIIIFNVRNKILISQDILNNIQGLYEFSCKINELKELNKQLKKEIKELSRENRLLYRENDYLNNTVEEFKARKVVKIADKMKDIF